MSNIRGRILVVVRWPVGGIRTYLRYVYGKLDHDKYDFTILGPNTEEMQILFNDLAHLRPTVILSGDESDASGFFRAATKAILSGKHDLIHSHGVTAGTSSTVPAALLRIPHVITLHDIFNLGQFGGFRGTVKKTIVSAALGLANCINPVGGDAERNLLDFFPRLRYRKDKIVTINHGIDVEQFNSGEKRDFRNELGLPKNVFLIGFFGRFMAPKGFVYLVDAIETLRRIEDLPMQPLVLAFGTGGFIREDTKYIRKMGLMEYFRFLPFVSNIAASLKGLDIVTMPSLWEASGLLAMETLVSGVPLIASTCVGLREVIEGSPATAISPKDSSGLAAAIAQAMRDPRRNEAEQFVSEAKSRFNAGRTAKELDALFARLLERSARRRTEQWK